MASTSSPLSSFTLCRSDSSRTGRNPTPTTRVHFRRQFRVSASCAATAERTATASRHSTASTGSLYEVLGIQIGAPFQEVKAAYRRLARVLHPDVASDCNGHEFMRVHEAYVTLSDPQKRAEYDRSLTTRRRSVGQPFSSVSVSATGKRSGATSFGFSRRRWDSDQCW